MPGAGIGKEFAKFELRSREFSALRKYRKAVAGCAAAFFIKGGQDGIYPSSRTYRVQPSGRVE